MLDQSLSSLTNFGLAVLAARVLGAGGLGVVTIGFTVYLIILSFQRAFVVDPLIVRSTTAEETDRRDATRSALTVVIASGITATLGMLVLGLVIPGPAGDGILLFAPWILVTQLQDMWRTVLFRDKRGAAATVNDASWVFGMAAGIPIAVAFDTRWAVVAAWGFGALLGAALGFVQMKVGPRPLRASIDWWKAEAWPLGRWLGLENLALTAGVQGSVFMLAAILGVANVGGLRAVSAIFAPLTLLGPAMSLPGLPAIARSLKRSPHAARTVAGWISLIAGTLVLSYLVVLSLFPSSLLSGVFGASFKAFRSLIIPVGVGQLIMAAQTGFYLFLKVQGRGRELLRARIVSSLCFFTFGAILAAGYGLTAAAWGQTIGRAIEAIAIFVAALIVKPKPEAVHD
jgi:O-antigen/teichoic acid export membrane protein